MARLKTAWAVSAGGVVYRTADGHVEVALCGRVDGGLWALPKGTPRQGESLMETALREVKEETGLDARVLEPLGDIAYWFVARRIRFRKTVHYYLMECVGGDTSRHDPEYDVVEWVPLAEALNRLSYKNEAQIVEKAADLIRRQIAHQIGTGGNATAQEQQHRGG